MKNNYLISFKNGESIMTQIKVKNDYTIESRNRIYIEEVGRQKAIIENQKKEIEFLRKELEATTKQMINYFCNNGEKK